jgi:hypothetical protein
MLCVAVCWQLLGGATSCRCCTAAEWMSSSVQQPPQTLPGAIHPVAVLSCVYWCGVCVCEGRGSSLCSMPTPHPHPPAVQWQPSGWCYQLWVLHGCRMDEQQCAVISTDEFWSDAPGSSAAPCVHGVDLLCRRTWVACWLVVVLSGCEISGGSAMHCWHHARHGCMLCVRQLPWQLFG